MVSGEAQNLETAIAQLSDLKREFDALESATVNAQQKLSLVIEQLETLTFDNSNEELSQDVDKTSIFTSSNISLLSDQLHSDVQPPDEIAVTGPTPKAIDDVATEITNSGPFTATADSDTAAGSPEPENLICAAAEDHQEVDSNTAEEAEASNVLSFSEAETEETLFETETDRNEIDAVDCVPTEAIESVSEADTTEPDNLSDKLELLAAETGNGLTVAEFQIEETLFHDADDKAQGLISDASETDVPELVEPTTVAEECADQANDSEVDTEHELSEIEMLIASFEDDENSSDEDDFLISSDCDISNIPAQEGILPGLETNADHLEAIDPASEQALEIPEDADPDVTKSEESAHIGEYDCNIGTLTMQDSMADEDCNGNMHQAVAFDAEEAAKDFELSAEFGDNLSDEPQTSGVSDVELKNQVEASVSAEALPAATSIDVSEETENSASDANVDAASAESEDTTEMSQSTSTVVPFPTSQEQAIAAPRKPRRRRVFATATGIAASVAAFAFALQMPEVQQLQDLPHVDQILQRLGDLQRYLA